MGFSVIDSTGRIKVNKTGSPGPTGATGATGSTGAQGLSGALGGVILADDPIYNDDFPQPTTVDLSNRVMNNLPVTNLAGGVGANSGTFWRGDGTWSAPGFVPGSFGDTGSPEIYIMSSATVGAINNVNGAFSSVGATVVSDTVAQWTRLTSSVAGTVADFQSSNTFGFVDPGLTFWSRIRTGSDITNVRIWIGLTNATFTNVDTHAGNCCAIRYSTAVPDGGWVGVTRSVATGLQSVTSTIAAIAASTLYTIQITVNNGGTLVTFTVNGASQTLSANIPTGVVINMCAAVVEISTATKILDVKYIKLWR